MDIGEIRARVVREGKDSLSQHTLTIDNFIRDIVREITGAFRFPFLIRMTDITATSDWLELDKDLRSILGVLVNDLKVWPISEEKYFLKKKSLGETNKAFYRMQWDKVAKRYKIKFVNVDAGTTVSLLVRDVWDDPSKLPSEFEEAVVTGAIFKYLTYLEGDDLDVAKVQKIRYAELVNQNYNLLASELQDDEDSRMLTNDEIEYYRNNFYEDDN